MLYFDDISFVNCAISESVNNMAKDRVFEGYYGIQYLINGSIDAFVNDNPVETVSGPHVFITFPGVSFTYGSFTGKTRGQAHVCFRGERVKKYMESGMLQLREKDIFIPITEPEPFLQTMRSLQRVLRVPGEIQHARAVLLLEELMLQLQEQTKEHRKSSGQYLSDLHQLRDKIAYAPCSDWNFEREAEKLSVSYVHFRRIFRQLTGWAPGQYLLECRLRYAEKLLMSTHLRISEIAGKCCFEDEFHFSRIFKKHRSMSPSRFRNQYGMQ